MIQNCIDFLEEENIKDSYFFGLKLINLKKNKKKLLKVTRNSHFKFILQQGKYLFNPFADDYIVDQTKQKIFNAFSIFKTNNLSLTSQVLFFHLSDVKQSNAEFQLKLYLISQQQVQQIGQTILNALTYIQVFLQDSKDIFHQTTLLCPDFSLQYEVYIAKTKLQIENMITKRSGQNSTLKNAFKKKNNQIIQIEDERVQVKQKKLNNYENVLRKSLYINTKKLIQVKRRKMELKQRSQQLSKSRISQKLNKSKSTILQKITNIFTSKQQTINSKKFINNDSPKNRKLSASQKSFAISPPAVGPSKYFKPQNKSYYHNLNLNRLKQRYRLEKSLNNPSQAKQNQMKQTLYSKCFKIFKITIFIVMLMVVFYYLARPSRKGKYKFFPFQQIFYF